MDRLTTDAPSNDAERLLNFAYAKNGEVWLRMYPDVTLADFVSKLCRNQGCDLTAEEVMEDGLMDCGDCTISLMYALAIQAAELRAKVKQYEDAAAEGLPEKDGVFFRGMKIPENCFECPMVDRYGTNPIWATFRCRVQEMPPIYVSEAKRGRREGCPAEALEGQK